MTPWTLLRAQLWRDRGGPLLLALAVALGALAAALTLVLGSAARRGVDLFFPAGDRTLEVEPPRVSLGGFSAKLDAATVARLAALPEVERAIPRMMLRVPAQSVYQGAFFGQQLNLTVEIAAEGIDESAMQAALFPGERFVWEPGQPIPACINDQLLAIYNTTFAPARGLPSLDGRLLRGFTLPFTVGMSMLGTGPAHGAVEQLSARIVCVSPDALLAGLTIPLAAARELNRRHGADDVSFSSVSVAARSSARVPELLRDIEALGLRVDDSRRELALRLGHAVRMGEWVLLSLALALLALAGLLVAQAFTWSIRARVAEFRLLSALGATRGFLMRQVLLEAALVGVGGGVLGTLVARCLTSIASSALLHQSLPVAIPPELLAFDLRAGCLPLALSFGTAVLGGAFALRSVQLDRE